VFARPSKFPANPFCIKLFVFIKSVSNNNKKLKSFLFPKMSEKQADAFTSNNNFSAEAQDCTNAVWEVFSNKPLVFW
jgi:hypothetical protein